MQKDEGLNLLDESGKPINKDAELNIRLKSENNDLSLAINQNKAQLENLSSQIKDSEKLLTQNVDKNNQILAEIEKQNTEKEKAIKAVASNKEVLTVYEKDIADKKLTIDNFQNDLDELVIGYNKKSNELEINFQKSETNYINKLSDINSSINDASKKLNTINNSIEDTSNINNGLKQSNAQLVLENKQLQKDNNDLSEVNNILSTNKENLDEDISSRLSHIESLSKLVVDGQDAIKEIQKEIEDINAQKVIAQQELETVMIKIKNINDKADYNDTNFEYIKEQGARCGIIVSPFTPIS